MTYERPAVVRRESVAGQLARLADSITSDPLPDSVSG